MTNKTNSTLVRGSRYVAGGTTEVNKTAIEWWERNVFEVDPSDFLYVVEKKFEGRLDLITAVYLGNENVSYWWVIAMLNNILDPYSEVTTGKIIRIPSKQRLDTMLSGKLGGVPSTREVPTSIMPIV